MGNIPPMSLQNPKIPSKSKRAEIADEAELFCISASKTVVFARLLVSVNDLHRGLSSPVFRVEQITQNQVPQGVPVRVRPPAPRRQKKPAPFRFRLAAKTARCWLLQHMMDIQFRLEKESGKTAKEGKNIFRRILLTK